VAERLTVLVAARDEERSIGHTVRVLRAAFPEADVLVADDGSRDGTATAADQAGGRVVRLPRLGKGQALALAECHAGPGPLLLCDADLEGDLTPLVEAGFDLSIAVFTERQGGGFGIAKRAARGLIRALSGFEPREPLSGQRALSPRARAACFPTAPGFGCEVRMTIDAARLGLSITEVELPLRHRATGRDVSGFAHRARQLLDAALACGPLARNYRGLRLPLVGWAFAAREPFVTLVGLADDLHSGPERGVRAHLRTGLTTGTLKAVAIPLYGLARTRSLSGALLVALAANFFNQLDTRPGRALKAYLALAPLVRAPLLPAVLIAPYDLREMTMLGDAGSNALGAMLGLSSVDRFTGRGRKLAIAALAGLNLLGEARSLGELIERNPLLARLDELGRP
jgi:glucosyl-3-phosphoglycerate synthase